MDQQFLRFGQQLAQRAAQTGDTAVAARLDALAKQLSDLAPDAAVERDRAAKAVRLRGRNIARRAFDDPAFHIIGRE